MTGIFKYNTLLLLLFVSVSGSVFALTDSELIAVRDGFDARRDGMLANMVTNPWPDISGSWGKQNFAMAALYRNTQITQANDEVIAACQLFLDGTESWGDFHWRGNLFFRIYRFFAHDSQYYPGRLTPAAEAKICEVLWAWAQSNSKISDANVNTYNTWSYWGSENHDMMHDSTAWSAASILKDVVPYKTYTYSDGGTAQQHYEAWTAYETEYLRQRAKKGLCIELGSATYTKYTLQSWYNFYDFAENQDLQKIAGMMLDLWWADWAESQINSVWGGGKSRVYREDSILGTSDGTAAMSWYYLNIGAASSKHPGIMCMATSTHRLPLVVMDLALDISGRGVYEKRSRRPGLKELPVPAGVPADTTVCDPDYGGIARYTYVRPEFILGTCMVPKRSENDWSAISSQNKWHGVIFANHKDSRVFPAVEGIPLDYGKTYNAHWSVQNKGTLIAQKIAGGHNGGMRVYFSSSYLTISQSGGVVFASSGNAYAAVRPAWGSYTWDDSNWIRLSDPYAPVIMEVAPSSDYGEVLSTFQSAVLAKIPSVTNGILTYTGLGGSGTFTFDTQGSQTPKINGVPVDYAPSYTFQSPFLNEDWASGAVTITKDDRDLTLDFNNVLSGSCGDWGYLDGDLDDNCVVNVSDLQIMAYQWLFDSSDPVSGSDDYPDITEVGWPLPGNYNIPKTTVVPVIDGSVSIGEWTDARTVEMVYPAFVTAPNTGTVQNGYQPPDSPDDYSLYGYLKWDDSNLYVLGVVYDQTHDSGDLTAICFNPFNNPSANFPTNVFSWILKSDCTIVPFYTAGPTNSVLACSNGVGNYVFEARMPWTDFISSYVPSNGDVHGFGLLAQDYDTPGVLGHFIYDFGSGAANVGTPSTYNTITLVDQMSLGEAGTSDADIDLNYKVNLADFANIAENWMQCTHPVLDGCVDAR
jgi:hypothetical protein